MALAIRHAEHVLMPTIPRRFFGLPMHKVLSLSLILSLVAVVNVSHASSNALAEVDALPYTDEQYLILARSLCMQFDRYTDNAQAFTLRRPKMCVALPRLCKTDRKHIGPRGLTRYTIARMFKIQDTETLETQLPAIISKGLTYSCSNLSSHALSDIPFHQTKRNYMKRAVFVGQISNFFNRFIFKDYEIEQDGQKRLAIDINAVEIVDGEPETILDYLDKVLAPTHDAFLGNARRDDLEDLRQMLINRGAMKARDLDCADGQRVYCPIKGR